MAQSPPRAAQASTPPLVAIYADESCIGNGREGDNPGGAAGVIEVVSPATGRLTRLDYWIAEPATTNNRMALRSVIEAFRVISRKGGTFRVVFTSDSQYLVKGMKEWVPGWIRRGWRRKEGALKNLDLWKQAVDAVGGHQVEWRWVHGHRGHPQNEYANFLATRAAKDQSDSGGSTPSAFEEWIVEQRALGNMTGEEPAAFPGGKDRPFRPSPPFPVSTTSVIT
jgi:ribonuclease HI